MTETAPHYRAPGWFTRNIFNKIVAGMTRARHQYLGQPGTGSPRPQDRRASAHTGEPAGLRGAGVPVAPRGEAQWVRNVRAAGGNLDLLVGRRGARVAREVDVDDAKVPVLRAYLKRWKAEVGIFFDGVGPDSDESDLRRIAPRHPVFVLESRA